MSRKNVTFLIGMGLLFVFICFFYFGRINWWQLAVLLIASEFSLVLLYNIDNIKELGLKKGDSQIYAKMKEIRDDIYAKRDEVEKIKKEIENNRDEVKEIVASIAQRIRFSTGKVGRLVDEYTHEMDVERELMELDELEKRVSEDKQKEKKKEDKT